MPRAGVWTAASAGAVLLFTSLAVVSHAADGIVQTSPNRINVIVKGGPIGSITSDPLPMTPSFARGITDYVWRCAAGTNTIAVTLTALHDDELRVGEQRGHSITITQDLLENQALVITGPWSRALSEASGVAETKESEDETTRGQREYWIRCLPHDFPQLHAIKERSPLPGWIVTGNINNPTGGGMYAMVLDTNGTPVWYRTSHHPGAVNVTVIGPNEIAWIGLFPANQWEDYNLGTQTTRWLSIPDTQLDLHELQKTRQGTYMMMSAPLTSNVDLSSQGRSQKGTIIDCVLYEATQNGRILWSWRASEHLSVAETINGYDVPFGSTLAFDAFHCNSLDVDPASGNILMSARHTNAVYLINKASGRVIWKLGGNSFGLDSPQHLNVVNDPQGTFNGQHDARFQPNSDVSLYDDQSFRPTLTARGAEYHLDFTTGTASLVWSYLAPDARNSAATGSFRRLYGGADNIIDWGVKAGSFLSEVDGAGNVTLEVTFPNGEISYRGVKVLPTMLSLNLLRATSGLPPAD